jgi:quercetin dioxygenase-like cupin family protein
VSAFDDLASIVPQQIWPGLVGRAVHGDEVTVAHIELEPGIEVPEHSHANEQVGVLLRGSLRFRIGEEDRQLEPGATWCIRADVPHSVQAGPDGATLVEVFAPPRADWAGLERLEPSAPTHL